jgi:hypothetical protein
LYMIADQLAIQLVPAVRERMQRIRFLTVMAVGTLVTEGFEDDSRQRDASPYLVWEWLVVQVLVQRIRKMGDAEPQTGHELDVGSWPVCVFGSPGGMHRLAPAASLKSA